MTEATECPFDRPPALKALQQGVSDGEGAALGRQPPWLVTRYAEQRAVLADRRVSAEMNRPGYPRQAPGNGSLSFIGMDDHGDDLLSGLAARIEVGELTRQEATAMAVLLLIAGHETTANIIALSTIALLEHPDQLAVLRETDDPKLVASAVEELLRYLDITHGGGRRVALEDIEVAGQHIPAGTGLIMPGRRP